MSLSSSLSLLLFSVLLFLLLLWLLLLLLLLLPLLLLLLALLVLLSLPPLLSRFGTLGKLDLVQRLLPLGEELGIVDFQKQLTRGHPAPLLEEDAGDLAGDLTDDLDLLVGANSPGGCKTFDDQRRNDSMNLDPQDCL